MEYGKSFYSEKVAELSEEFVDVFRFWLASIPTAEYGKRFYNEKVAELSEEFADAIRFRPASKPTTVEAPEVESISPISPISRANLNFAPTATFRGRAESRESGHQAEGGLLQLLQPWVLMPAKF